MCRAPQLTVSSWQHTKVTHGLLLPAWLLQPQQIIYRLESAGH
jgi:hypothetical protein